MIEGIFFFIRWVSALYFLLIYFSIIELLFFKSAASTYLQSSLSLFFVIPENILSLKVFLFAYLTCVCDRCTRSARRLTWCDGLTSCIDSATPLCRWVTVCGAMFNSNTSLCYTYAVANFLFTLILWQTFVSINVCTASNMSARTSGSFVPFTSQQSSFLTHFVSSECWHYIVLSTFCFYG